MKKVLMLLLVVVLLVSVVPVAVTANATTNNEIHLLNPVSIVTEGHLLYVADNITASQSAVHIFDISTESPTYLNTLEYQGNVTLMRSYFGIVYILFSDCYIEYNYDEDNSNTVEETITDLAVYQYGEQMLTCTANNGRVYIEGNNQGWQADNLMLIGDTLYIQTESTWTPITIKQSSFGLQFAVGEPTDCLANDIIAVGENLATVTDTTVDFNGTTITATIVSATSDDSQNIYTLDSKEVTKWQLVEGVYTLVSVDTFIIGSDTVKIDSPTHEWFDSYTLVETNGYPTNILYMTTGSDSIETPLTLDAGEHYTILGYSQDYNNGYYYVLYKDQFAWVKRSFTNINEESTLKVIDNAISGSVNYNATLTTASSAYVYSLPTSANLIDNYLRDTITQTADNKTQVKLLNYFTALDGIDWYLISYTNSDGEKAIGWITQGGVGNIVSTVDSNVNIMLDKDTPHLKVNATISDNVYVYATQDLLDNQRITSLTTNELLTLEDNINVNVITIGEDATYVQVVLEGHAYYGWVHNDNLMELGGVSTTLIIGLSTILLAVLILLLTLNLVKHSKKKNAPVEKKN